VDYLAAARRVLALCGFWALHLYLASQDGSTLFQGIIMK
jgi:hypothetical protein